MANHKRKKSKRNVRCCICTPHRWMGNSGSRLKPKDQAKKKAAKKEIKES